MISWIHHGATCRQWELLSKLNAAWGDSVTGSSPSKRERLRWPAPGSSGSHSVSWHVPGTAGQWVKQGMRGLFSQTLFISQFTGWPLVVQIALYQRWKFVLMFPWWFHTTAALNWISFTGTAAEPLEVDGCNNHVYLPALSRVCASGAGQCLVPRSARAVRTTWLRTDGEVPGCRAVLWQGLSFRKRLVFA